MIHYVFKIANSFIDELCEKTGQNDFDRAVEKVRSTCQWVARETARLSQPWETDIRFMGFDACPHSLLLREVVDHYIPETFGRYNLPVANKGDLEWLEVAFDHDGCDLTLEYMFSARPRVIYHNGQAIALREYDREWSAFVPRGFQWTGTLDDAPVPIVGDTITYEIVKFGFRGVARWPGDFIERDSYQGFAQAQYKVRNGDFQVRK